MRKREGEREREREREKKGERARVSERARGRERGTERERERMAEIGPGDCEVEVLAKNDYPNLGCGGKQKESKCIHIVLIHFAASIGHLQHAHPSVPWLAAKPSAVSLIGNAILESNSLVLPTRDNLLSKHYR